MILIEGAHAHKYLNRVRHPFWVLWFCYKIISEKRYLHIWRYQIYLHCLYPPYWLASSSSCFILIVKTSFLLGHVSNAIILICLLIANFSMSVRTPYTDRNDYVCLYSRQNVYLALSDWSHTVWIAFQDQWVFLQYEETKVHQPLTVNIFQGMPKLCMMKNFFLVVVLVYHCFSSTLFLCIIEKTL